jgi:hypothetical protein
MDYDQLIKNWHTKAADEDYFSKFVFEYLAFVAYLKRKKFTNASNDRSAIQRLKQDEVTRDQYFREIEVKPELKGAWGKIVKELKRARLGNASGSADEVQEIRWWNCSQDDFHQKTSEEHERTMGVIHGLDDWGNMVEFWYSIRNNLFHGAKNPQDNRDRLLVENGYKTLQPLVELFLLGGIQ